MFTEKKNSMDIYDFFGENYMPALRQDGWVVAYLNHGSRFTPENFTKLERHITSDEVFVLLEGSATLITGDKQEKTEMVKGRIYNIPKGIWHHIITTPKTKVLIVENSDVTDSNTEFMDVKQ